MYIDIRKKEAFEKLLDKSNKCRNLRLYVYNLFGKKLESNQYWALRDMLDPKVRFIYYSSARQSGKTHTIATFQALTSIFPEFVIPHYEDEGHCYVFAPKQEQAGISFSRFSNLVHMNRQNAFAGTFLTDKYDRIGFKNGFEVRAITASRNAEIEGLTTHIIILDESQAISPYKVRESIFPMGGGIRGGAKIIQCGVPGILGSHFHKAFKNAYSEANPFGYRIHEYKWEKCPRLDKAFIMSLMSDEESFARNYELSWDRNNFGYFITMEEYDACAVDYDMGKLRQKALEEHWPFHWGLDFAKHRDSTVLTIMVQDPQTVHFYLVDLIELKGIDYTAQVGYFKNMYEPDRVRHVCADQSSAGEPTIELMKEGGMQVTGLNFHIQNKDKIYKNFRHVIQLKTVHWPKKCNTKELKRFQQQLTELEVEYKSSGLMSVHHALDDNTARDDYPDSACLCVWSAAEYIEPSAGLI